MQLEVEVVHKTKETIEVNFPIYTEQEDIFDEGGWWHSWSCLQADGTRCDISVRGDRDGNVNWDFDAEPGGDLASQVQEARSKRFFRESTAEEFNKALAAMRSDMSHLPGRIPPRKASDF